MVLIGSSARGGLTSKIHAIVDAQGRPINLCLTGGLVADCSQAEGLIERIKAGGTLLADKAYDTDAIRKTTAERKIWANIPPKSNRKNVFSFDVDAPSRPEIVAGAVIIRLEAGASADRVGRTHFGYLPMMFPSNRVRIMVATKPIDFRKGHDGLVALVSSVLRKDPFTGTVFVFRSRRADRLKLLYWDGTGLVMAYKRLEDTSFTWPTVSDGVMALNHAQFEALFSGLDWGKVKALEARAPAAAE